jgi:hypothetical protein
MKNKPFKVRLLNAIKAFRDAMKGDDSEQLTVDEAVNAALFLRQVEQNSAKAFSLVLDEWVGEKLHKVFAPEIVMLYKNDNTKIPGLNLDIHKTFDTKKRAIEVRLDLSFNKRIIGKSEIIIRPHDGGGIFEVSDLALDKK